MCFFTPKERTVATIGYPGHGKSVFLAGLFWDSFFALSRTLKPYAVEAPNEEARKLFFGNARKLYECTLPDANPRRKPEPAILEFKGIPRANSQRRYSIRLVFYDVAGEVFDDENLTREYAPYVINAHDLIFLFDPMPPFNALSAGELVSRVRQVVEEGKKKNFIKKNIIIALTKMDELRDRDEWWARMINELWPDEAPSHLQLPLYLRDMDYLSARLRNWWTDEARQAYNLINSLPTTTRFCAVSSLGHQPVWDCLQCGVHNQNVMEKCGQCDAVRADADLRLTREPEPFRVRDPLFWIFRAAGVM